MPSNLWLITEDTTDFDVIKQLFLKRNVAVTLRLVALQSGSGGIGELAKQLPARIKEVRANKKYKHGDCIVVLHDRDAEVQHVQNKKAYGEIERICRDEGAILIIADDKIEAWMLADQGLCAWLNVAVKSWDGDSHVKDELERFVRKAYPKMRYGGQDRDKIIANLDGTGSEKSPSMQAAFDRLTAASCL